MLIWFRAFFFLLIAATITVALVPGPIMGIWMSGENRHAYAFLVLPIASSVAWPRVGPHWHLLAFAAVGGGIELGQSLIHTWHVAEWDDWFVDVGAAAGSLFVVAAVRWLARS